MFEHSINENISPTILFFLTLWLHENVLNLTPELAMTILTKKIFNFFKSVNFTI